MPTSKTHGPVVLDANGESLILDTSAAQFVQVRIQGSAFQGTVAYAQALAGGTWFDAAGTNTDGAFSVQSSDAFSSPSSPDITRTFPVVGRQLRVRVGPYTSGAVTVTATAHHASALGEGSIAGLAGLPPPPSPPVQLVDPATGRATAAFTNYLTRLDEWHRRLVTTLGE